MHSKCAERRFDFFWCGYLRSKQKTNELIKVLVVRASSCLILPGRIQPIGRGGEQQQRRNILTAIASKLAGQTVRNSPRWIDQQRSKFLKLIQDDKVRTNILERRNRQRIA